MTLAVMQPYLFPYIGYFQLIRAADKFVVYDDVNFIKQGWINRNRIIVNGKEFVFTVPLQKISSFQPIRDTLINKTLYVPWKEKFLQTLRHAYKNAPYFLQVYNMVEEVLNSDSFSISMLAYHGLTKVCAYLNIGTVMIESSVYYNNSSLKKQSRIIDICKKENADHYINMIGGKDLYSTADFAEQNIKLSFLTANSVTCNHNDILYNTNYSVIHTLMLNNPDAIVEMLHKFSLVSL